MVPVTVMVTAEMYNRVEKATIKITITIIFKIKSDYNYVTG
jgi:hypothetical protein